MGKLKDDGVQPSPLVEAFDNIQAGDEEASNAVVLQGYLGGPKKVRKEVTLVDGTKVEVDVEDDRWRLYRTLDMKEYLLFRDGDVAHYANVYPNVPEENPAAGQPVKPISYQPMLIWLARAAKVSHVTDFFAGDVADMYMPSADLAARFEAIAGGLAFNRMGGGTNAPLCKV